MKFVLCYLVLIFLIFQSCTKKIGTPIIPAPISSTSHSSCKYQSTSIVSFSATIGPLFMNKCKDCHLSPSTFACDSYQSIKGSAQGGSLLQYITNTDPSSPVMPPPPYVHLDSCELKAINLWVTQGCLNN